MFADSLPAVVWMLSAVCKGGALQVPVTARMLGGARYNLTRRDEVVPGKSSTVVICFNLQDLLQIKLCVCHLWHAAGLVPSGPAHI